MDDYYRALDPICRQPNDYGGCPDGTSGSLVRYFFVPELKTCEVFGYSGCEGNENNFLTYDECLNKCSLDSWRFQPQQQEREPEPPQPPPPKKRPQNTGSSNGGNNWSNMVPSSSNGGSVNSGVNLVGYSAIEGNCVGSIISSEFGRSLIDCSLACDDESTCYGFLYHDALSIKYTVCQLTGRCFKTNNRVAGGVFYKKELGTF